MGKFSKKLVSKCIYIQILKCSETELLGQFMETDGWMLTYSWLQDAVASKNWPLVQEILELFLLCPVDVERLKSNSAPKLVKSLSKEGSHEGKGFQLEILKIILFLIFLFKNYNCLIYLY